MSTRSAIIFQNDNTFHGVYCHMDGYPSHQLPILKEHYNDVYSIRKLLSKGDISQLRTTITWDYYHDKTKTRKPQPLYYNERGGKSFQIITTGLLNCLENYYNCGCEYAYIFIPTAKKWVDYKLSNKLLECFKRSKLDQDIISKCIHL